MYNLILIGGLALSLINGAPLSQTPVSPMDANSITDLDEIQITYDQFDEMGIIGSCKGKKAGIQFYAIPAKGVRKTLPVESGRWCFAIDDSKGLMIAAAGNCWDQESGIVDSGGLKKDADVSDIVGVNLGSHSPMPGHPDVNACLQKVGNELTGSEIEAADFLGSMISDLGEYWFMTPEELEESGKAKK